MVPDALTNHCLSRDRFGGDGGYGGGQGGYGGGSYGGGQGGYGGGQGGYGQGGGESKLFFQK